MPTIEVSATMERSNSRGAPLQWGQMIRWTLPAVAETLTSTIAKAAAPSR